MRMPVLLGGGVKRLIKHFLERTPYRIVRDRDANRFQAIESAIRNIKARGFHPRVVIDGGAHLGSFSVAAKRIFPLAEFHLVEPQLACIKSLKALCAEEGFALHECALAERVGEISMTRTTEPSTGAYISPNGGAETNTVKSCTLDTLFAKRISTYDRTLLKMDLQGYELFALRGGARVLKSIEVILTEVSFFSQAYEPKIIDLMGYLDESGFQLYDIAALSGRMRDNRVHQGDFLFARKGSQLVDDASWD
jgi:FkbM family methyltransferase